MRIAFGLTGSSVSQDLSRGSDDSRHPISGAYTKYGDCGIVKSGADTNSFYDLVLGSYLQICRGEPLLALLATTD